VNSFGSHTTEPPSLEDVLAAAVVFRVPLAVPFRGVTARTGILLSGPAGWGEFSPFDDYSPQLAARWLASALESAYVGWPAPLRSSVRVNGIIPALDAHRAAELARRLTTESGMTTVKVKVAGSADRDHTGGEHTEGDVERLAAVRQAVGPDVAIRIDANGRWSAAKAIDLLPELAQAAGGIEYVEQPVADLRDLAHVRRETGLEVAVDESLRLAYDLSDPALHEAIRASADVVVAKVGPLGGVRRTLDVVSAIGLPTVVSGAMDTAVGLSAGVAAAASLPVEPRDCGLGTGALLAEDVVTEPWQACDGRLSVMSITPDPRALERAQEQVPAGVQRRWLHRLQIAWKAGAPQLLGWS